jgi:hypothetical protein
MSAKSKKRAHADDLLAKATKVLKRTNSEETATKKCYDNLKTYSDPEVYVKKNDNGATPFEDVLAAVRFKKSNIKFAMGCKFYRDLKVRHPKQAHSCKELLVVPKPMEVVPPALLQAMVATKLKTPDHTQATVWVNLQEAPNVTVIIGIVRWMMSLRPGVPSHSLPCHAIVRWVKRTQVSTKYPLYFEAFFEPFGHQVLIKAWKKANSRLSKTKMAAVEFCSLNLSLASAVLP